MIKLLKKTIATIRTYFHCFACPRFSTCQIKFHHKKGEVYTSVKAKDGFMYFDNPVECARPIED